MPQLPNLRTPLGNLTSKILNSVTSLKNRMRMKDSSVTHYGFTALKPSPITNIGEKSDTFQRLYIDGAEYEHHQDSYDDIYSDVFESTRISETSTALDTLPPRLPILPNTKFEEKGISEVVDHQQSTHLHKGQLKVAIYINSGLLTIHVIQGRHFTSKWKTTCDSYVQVELIPEKNPGCHTDVIRDTNHPMFDEKFSFELLPEDRRKRVLISVYHKTFKSPKSELLGSMSFGLQNITENKAFVNGWYYLLPEGTGHRKHLQVSECYLRKSEQQAKDDSSLTSPITYKTLPVLLTRGRSGYGFTVTGGCPAKVCRVDSGGPAEVAGLKSGDCIIRINKEKVHTVSTDGVARIIKHCTRRVLLEVQRPHKTVESMAPQLPWRPMYNDLDSSMSSSEEEDDGFAAGKGWYGDNDKENSGKVMESTRKTCQLRRRVTFRDFH